jgi:hypothetical protein
MIKATPDAALKDYAVVDVRSDDFVVSQEVHLAVVHISDLTRREEISSIASTRQRRPSMSTLTGL